MTRIAGPFLRIFTRSPPDDFWALAEWERLESEGSDVFELFFLPTPLRNLPIFLTMNFFCFAFLIVVAAWLARSALAWHLALPHFVAYFGCRLHSQYALQTPAEIRGRFTFPDGDNPAGDQIIKNCLLGKKQQIFASEPGAPPVLTPSITAR